MSDTLHWDSILLLKDSILQMICPDFNIILILKCMSEFFFYFYFLNMIFSVASTSVESVIR